MTESLNSKGAALVAELCWVLHGGTRSTQTGVAYYGGVRAADDCVSCPAYIDTLLGCFVDRDVSAWPFEGWVATHRDVSCVVAVRLASRDHCAESNCVTHSVPPR